jgi:hypothetical protein
MRVKIAANFSADRKAGRYGYANASHFMKTGTFAAEQFAHLGVAFSFTISKEEDALFLVRHF